MLPLAETVTRKDSSFLIPFVIDDCEVHQSYYIKFYLYCVRNFTYARVN